MVTKFNPFQGADEERKKRALQQALKGKAAGAMSSVASAAGAGLAVGSGLVSNGVNNISLSKDANFDTVEITGDLKIGGELLIETSSVNASKLVLNLDREYVEKVLSHLKKKDLDALYDYLDELKLMIEKTGFERT